MNALLLNPRQVKQNLPPEQENVFLVFMQKDFSVGICRIPAPAESTHCLWLRNLLFCKEIQPLRDTHCEAAKLNPMMSLTKHIPMITRSKFFISAKRKGSFQRNVQV